MPDIKNHVRVFSEEIVEHIGGTEAEYFASTMIAKSFKRHELETAMQEFSVSVYTPLAFGAIALLSAVLALLSTVHIALSVIAVLVAVIFAVLWVAELIGHPILSLYLPLVSSQNIIARHNAQLIIPEGDGQDDEEIEALTLRASNGRLGRKVVVVAHYDSPKQDLTYHPVIAPYRHFLSMALSICIVLLPLVLLTQFLDAETSVLRSIGYFIVCVASVYLLLYGVIQLINHFVMRGVPGANDNASGVAVLLGLANRIRPMYRNGQLVEHYDEFEGEDFDAFDEVMAEFDAKRETEPESEPADSQAFVRRGLPVARQLNMFGDDTVIEFVSSEEMMRLTQTLPEAPSVAKSSVLPAAFAQPVEEGVSEVMPRTPVDPQATVALTQEQIQHAKSLMEEGTAAPTEVGSDAQHLGAHGDKAVCQTDNPDDIAHQVTAVSEPTPRHFAGNHVASSQQPEVDEHLTPQERRAKEMREAEARILEQQKARRLSRAQAAHVALTTSEEAEDLRGLDQGLNGSKHAEAGRQEGSEPHGFTLLRDVPDPSISAINPFSADEIQVVGDMAEEPTNQAATPQEEPAPVFDVIGGPAKPEETVSSGGQESIFQRLSDKFSGLLKRGDASDNAPRQRLRRRPRNEEESMSAWLDLDENFDAKQSGRTIGTWDNFDKTASIKRIQPSDSSHQQNQSPAPSNDWRGGAARGDGEEMTEEDIEAAAELVLGLGDPELVGHDIWLVALGSSECDHAGMKSFLKEYRSQLRNALFINVKGVGAGDLTLRVREGKLGYRLSDRRLGSIMAKTGKQIHHSVDLTRQPWVETDLTPALKAGLRGITITGLTKGAVAHSHWSTDTLSKVKTGQVKAVIEMVCQAIRQS